uniref:MINDY deubiquitinase domain-containing protein n=1 Tax=Araucaria cunninghamii TaxID=56994 RepID=A0A0D6QZZ5_ARACU
MIMGGNEERKGQQEEKMQVVYKTKVVEFLGRSIPIILQNDNGPCPLLAICNVLLLRNIINLSSNITEISLEKLLSLVAERLLDANSNTENKDDGYVQNQQQNISDAINLLPRLATGLDVNVRFRHIHDFEFTPECAIFDLLDIGLVHGWIIDPEDKDTARVIASNSYNTLQERLVALNERKTQELKSRVTEEDSVDFVAATTAALGVPSPSLSRGKSFEDSSVSTPRENKGRLEEDEELKKALYLSTVDSDVSLLDIKNLSVSATSHPYVGTERLPCESLSSPSEVNTQNADQFNYTSEAKREDGNIAVENGSRGGSVSCSNELNDLSAKVLDKVHTEQLLMNRTEGDCDKSKNLKDGEVTKNANVDPQLLSSESSDVSPELHSDLSNIDETSHGQQVMVKSSCQWGSINSDLGKPVEGSVEEENVVGTDAISQWEVPLSENKKEPIDNSEDVNSSLEGSEPLYEGEELVDSVPPVYESREPLYEGEVVLAEQADRAVLQSSRMEFLDVTSLQEQEPLSAEDREGELIQHFLRNNASQLTVYGLFCLQEGLKERALSVFFRNNHFSTMFKFNGEIYILATDQGYINQPDLVWEKLNEFRFATCNCPSATRI